MPPADMEASAAAGKPRRCRDVLFLVVFVAFWVGMLVVGGMGFAEGDPKVLLFGADYRGDLCNKANKAENGTAGADLTGEKAMHWLNPAAAFSVGGTWAAMTLHNTHTSIYRYILHMYSIHVGSSPCKISSYPYF